MIRLICQPTTSCRVGRSRPAENTTAKWLLLVLLAWAQALAQVRAQGLNPDSSDGSFAQSAGAVRSLAATWKASVAWRNSFRLAPRRACAPQPGSLCSGTLAPGSEEAAVLRMAVAPQAYDSRSAWLTAGWINVMGPVRDQRACGACVSFVTLATAQTAAAVRMRSSVGPPLSEQDFYFCQPQTDAGEGEVLNCGSGMKLSQGLSLWINLHRRGKLPVLASCLPYQAAEGTCNRRCTRTDSTLLQGTFKRTRLTTLLGMQQHIRRHGSIMCPLVVTPDMRRFFASNPRGIYTGPGTQTGLTQVEGHAVQVVGYDNDQEAWIAKNTWGAGFADGGYFRIAFNASRICAPEDTHGLIFEPRTPRPPVPLNRLAPAPSHPNCFWYTAAEGDYMELLEHTFGVSLQRLLLDNADRLKAPDVLPAGFRVLVCGAQLPAEWAPPGVARPGNRSAAVPRGSASPTPAAGSASEQRVLLDMKGMVDPSGRVLTSWKPGSPHCSWAGVACDSGGRVASITINQKNKLDLFGQLPTAALLRQLPGLHTFNLSDSRLPGTLPEDWSTLSQLETVCLMWNRLSGTLPVSWGSWPHLKELHLHGNRLTGTLPVSWGNLSKMKKLWIQYNTLSGTLPAAWSGMTSLAHFGVNGNKLVGSIPLAWGGWTKLVEVGLNDNSGLVGCLPANWSARLNKGSAVYVPGDWQEGTRLRGFC